MEYVFRWQDHRGLSICNLKALLVNPRAQAVSPKQVTPVWSCKVIDLSFKQRTAKMRAGKLCNQQTSLGKSRIVRRIASAYVTSAQSDIDFIVTEHGAADLRATTLMERRTLIAQLAGPRFRDALLEGQADDLA